jgi:exodeoxyribonuclease VIII
MSSSGVGSMLRSPAHYKASLLTPRPPTPAMLFGTVIHTAVLEPGKLESAFVLIPADAPEKRSKVDKEWWSNFNAENAGRIVLTQEQADRALRVRDAVLDSPSGGALLQTGGIIESSLMWDFDGIGVQCKARPDYTAPDKSFIVDVKTSSDATMQGFARSIANYGYHVQAQFYRHGSSTVYGTAMPRWFWLVVETEPPFGVAAFSATPKMLSYADARIEQALALYKQCVAVNYWPGYEPTIREIELPAWAYRENTDAENFTEE